MTNKHFIALADMIRAHNQTQLDAKNSRGEFSPLQIEALADFCKQQNENFNRGRWVDYINGEVGPSGGSIK